MKFASVCSGIEAASVAFEPLGFAPQWFSEIEPFPCEVLNHRFPTVPNLGDMTKLTNNETFQTSSIDLLVGGTPCQSFSVAGLRGGLADPRGNLMLTFLSLADAKKPRWILWENVYGVLSSNGGKDFGTFLGALGELGYGFAYRVLDAQHFGVAQRRRRVFVVGYLGDWRPAAAVLFERESLSRDSKPSRKKGKETPTDAQGGVGESGKSWWDGGQTAATLTKQNAGGNQRMPNKENFGAVIEQVAQPITMEKIAGPIDASYHKGQGSRQGGEREFVAQPIQICFNDANGKRANRPNGGCYITENPKASPTVTCAESDLNVLQPISLDCYNQSVTGDKVGIIREQHGTNMNAIAVDCYNQTINENTTQTIGSSASDINHIGGVLQTMAIRRLTPRECERLQGFPDDFTKIPYRNKPADQCPDGPRYKACGNSMAVPVMRWIGQRIQLIDTIIN